MSAPSKRYLYIWLPRLSLDRLARAEDVRLNGPFVTCREERGAFRVVNANPSAREQGIGPGASLADARALCPDLLSEPVDPQSEVALLRALRRWCDRFTPSVAVDEAPLTKGDNPDGLQLDVSGATHLFGGEDGLLNELAAGLADLQLSARLAVADTPSAAKAWAKFGAKHGRSTSIPVGESKAYCAKLPVESLESSASYDLRRAGLQTIGQLYDIKSIELNRRFGLDVCTRLDKMLGRHPEPLRLLAMSRPFATRMTLPEPIMHTESVQALLTRLCTSLLARLEREGLGARGFALSVWGPDEDCKTLETGFARPTHNVRAVARQFARPLDALQMPFGVERLRLQACAVAATHPRQGVLDENGAAQDAMDRLITLLGNRVGFDSVRTPSPSQSHLPERECTSVGVTMAGVDTPDWPARRAHRPLRLFAPERIHTLEPGDPPRRFEWRRTVYDRASVSAPERIAPEWWSDRPGPLRDYWRVATHQGQTLWLSSRPTLPHERDWSVAGVFA